jgi:hypothetical protein
MSSPQFVSKLVELQSKTDRQLAEIIGRSLENGLILAQAADTQCSSGNRAMAEMFLAKARRCRDQAENLLPTVHLQDLRVPLEQKREALRRKLAALVPCREQAAWC